MKRITVAVALWMPLIGASAGLRPANAEIAAGQINDFEQGTTLGWRHGQENPHAPRVQEDGGPQGAGDAFLRVSAAGGFGAGSKLAMFNDDGQWLGNYVGAGITALEVDLNNVGFTPLTMRFMLEGSGGKVFTDGFSLSGESGWQHARFSLAPDDLISSGDILRTLDDVENLWLFHNPSASHPGPGEEAILFVDNLEAVGMSIPPPLEGDYNGNSQVEQADLDLVLLHWGSPAEPRPAAWVNDLPEGQIDQNELDGVLLNWGNAAEPLNAAGVPEPQSCVLIATAVILMVARGRRSRYRCKLCK